ncbi:hypothetical protein Tco_1404038 [Tanacetum coccineum]
MTENTCISANLAVLDLLFEFTASDFNAALHAAMMPCSHKIPASRLRADRHPLPPLAACSLGYWPCQKNRRSNFRWVFIAESILDHVMLYIVYGMLPQGARRCCQRQLRNPCDRDDYDRFRTILGAVDQRNRGQQSHPTSTQLGIPSSPGVPSCRAYTHPVCNTCRRRHPRRGRRDPLLVLASMWPRLSHLSLDCKRTLVLVRLRPLLTRPPIELKELKVSALQELLEHGFIRIRVYRHGEHPVLVCQEEGRALNIFPRLIYDLVVTSVCELKEQDYLRPKRPSSPHVYGILGQVRHCGSFDVISVVFSKSKEGNTAEMSPALFYRFY